MRGSQIQNHRYVAQGVGVRQRRHSRHKLLVLVHGPEVVAHREQKVVLTRDGSLTVTLRQGISPEVARIQFLRL